MRPQQPVVGQVPLVPELAAPAPNDSMHWRRRSSLWIGSHSWRMRRARNDESESTSAL